MGKGGKTAIAPLKAERVFQVGWGFSRTADIVSERYRHERGSDLLAALVVNSAFAVEVYLKCVLLVEGKAAPREHSLKKLFADLDRTHQSRIKKLFDESVGRNRYAKRIQAADPAFTYRLGAVLNATSDAFEEWRYLYEVRPKTRIFYGLAELKEAIERLIIELKPEWWRQLLRPLGGIA